MPSVCSDRGSDRGPTLSDLTRVPENHRTGQLDGVRPGRTRGDAAIIDLMPQTFAACAQARRSYDEDQVPGKEISLLSGI